MESPSFIVEILGVCLVFMGLFKLDGINKTLGTLDHFMREASEEIKELRKMTHDHANKLFYLEYLFREKENKATRRPPDGSDDPSPE
tara:strand:- start:18 stop:278 length:261 start_codon:yes stop_codon:yes gene_type:complete